MFEGLKAVREEIENATITNPDRDEIRDGYQLRFVGKDYAKFISTLPTETMLVPDTEWNNKAENKDSQNIFITGDNLDALKHLVNAYERQIKCIYIDPPYNTGSDGFVYNDTFNFTDAQLKEKLGMTDSDVARLRALNGKCSHSAWLTFMLPRLILAKRMLADDGVIFISIDDNEQSNLKLLCDEIFDENNFVSNMIWKNKSGGANDVDNIACDTEHILAYAKNKKSLQIYIDTDATVTTNYNLIDADGRRYSLDRLDKQSLGYQESLDFPIVGPDGKTYVVEHKNPNNKVARWRWGQDTVKERYDELVFKYPYVYTKNYEKEGIIPRNLLSDERFGRTRTGKTAFTDLFEGVAYFSFPKPVKLIKYLSAIGSTGTDIVLDFFAGSSTTAHAVMQLNLEDKGNRKYIMVQLDEPVASGSEAEKAGYKTIDEISRDRIKKAAKKIGDKSGFKHYKLAKVSDNLVLDKIDNFDPTKPNLLADDMVKPFSGKDLGTGLKASGLNTILTTWTVDDGYTLTTPIEEIKFSNYIAYSPKDSHRLYLISAGWTTDNTHELLNLIGRNELSVQTIIVYNHSFDFKTLTELKNNMKSVLEGNVEIIERF